MTNPFDPIHNLIENSPAYQLSKRLELETYSPALFRVTEFAARFEASVPSFSKADAFYYSNIGLAAKSLNAFYNPINPSIAQMLCLPRLIQSSYPLAITNILKTPSYFAAQSAVSQSNWSRIFREFETYRRLPVESNTVNIDEESAIQVAEAVAIAVPDDAENKHSILDQIKCKMTPEVVYKLIYLLIASTQFVLLFSPIDNASKAKIISALYILERAVELTDALHK